VLYHLLYEFLSPLGAYWSPLKVLNVIQYVTFRTAAATLTALLISLLFGPWLIRFKLDSIFAKKGQSRTMRRQALRRWAEF